MVKSRWLLPCLLPPVLFAAGTAQAYVGPGAGMTAIGTVVALFGALLLAVIGFVWYPVKRILARKKAGDAADHSQKRARPDTGADPQDAPDPERRES